jgi:hypothetical protein
MSAREPEDIDGRINDWLEAQFSRVKPWVQGLHWGQLLIVLFVFAPVLAWVFVPIGYEFWVLVRDSLPNREYTGGTWSQLPVLQWFGLNDAAAPESYYEWRSFLLPVMGLEMLTILWWWFGGRKPPRPANESVTDQDGTETND